MQYKILLDIDDADPPQYAKVDVEDLKTKLKIHIGIENLGQLDESIADAMDKAKGFLSSLTSN